MFANVMPGSNVSPRLTCFAALHTHHILKLVDIITACLGLQFCYKRLLGLSGKVNHGIEVITYQATMSSEEVNMSRVRNMFENFQ